jgi:hypothetical protein
VKCFAIVETLNFQFSVFSSYDDMLKLWEESKRKRPKPSEFRIPPRRNQFFRPLHIQSQASYNWIPCNFFAELGANVEKLSLQLQKHTRITVIIPGDDFVAF